MMVVYYYDKPTIGYCRKCGVTAIHHDGLRCPECGDQDLSIFEWDGVSPHPESE